MDQSIASATQPPQNVPAKAPHKTKAPPHKAAKTHKLSPPQKSPPHKPPHKVQKQKAETACTACRSAKRRCTFSSSTQSKCDRCTRQNRVCCPHVPKRKLCREGGSDTAVDVNAVSEGAPVIDAGQAEGIQPAEREINEAETSSKAATVQESVVEGGSFQVAGRKVCVASPKHDSNRGTDAVLDGDDGKLGVAEHMPGDEVDVHAAARDSASRTDAPSGETRSNLSTKKLAVMQEYLNLSQSILDTARGSYGMQAMKAYPNYAGIQPRYPFDGTGSAGGISEQMRSYLQGVLQPVQANKNQGIHPQFPFHGIGASSASDSGENREQMRSFLRSQDKPNFGEEVKLVEANKDEIIRVEPNKNQGIPQNSFAATMGSSASGGGETWEQMRSFLNSHGNSDYLKCFDVDNGTAKREESSQCLSFASGAKTSSSQAASQDKNVQLKSFLESRGNADSSPKCFDVGNGKKEETTENHYDPPQSLPFTSGTKTSSISTKSQDKNVQDVTTTDLLRSSLSANKSHARISTSTAVDDKAKCVQDLTSEQLRSFLVSHGKLDSFLKHFDSGDGLTGLDAPRTHEFGEGKFEHAEAVKGSYEHRTQNNEKNVKDFGTKELRSFLEPSEKAPPSECPTKTEQVVNGQVIAAVKQGLKRPYVAINSQENSLSGLAMLADAAAAVTEKADQSQSNVQDSSLPSSPSAGVLNDIVTLPDRVNGALRSVGGKRSNDGASGISSPPFLLAALQIAIMLAMQVHNAESSSYYVDLLGAATHWTDCVRIRLKANDSSKPNANSQDNLNYLSIESAEIRCRVSQQSDTLHSSSAAKNTWVIHFLGLVFYQLFSGEAPGSELKLLEASLCGTCDESEDDGVSNQSKHQCGLASSSSDGKMGSCKTSQHHLKMLGVPGPLSNLIFNFIQGDLSGNEAYTKTIDIISDLQLMIGNPSKFLFDLDGDEASKLFLEYNRTIISRSHEVETILSHYRNSLSGHCELAVITGDAGSGKSWLAQQVVRSIISEGGICMIGKIEKCNQSIPFSALSSALDQFCDMIIRERHTDWARLMGYKLQAAFGRDACYLIQLIPKLRHIIGDCTMYSANLLPRLNSSNSMQALLLCQMVEVISLNSNVPVSLFMDDTEWVDQASLSIISQLLKRGNKKFFFLGCSRNDETNQGNLFWKMIGMNNISPTFVQLIKMEVGALNGVISDMLCLPSRSVRSLSAIVHQKTRGNLLFVSQMMLSLYRDDLLYHDMNHKRWKWDEELINAAALPDSVLICIVDSISKLPSDIKSALNTLAMLGTSTKAEVLQVLESKLDLKLIEPLEMAAVQGLVTNLNGSFHFTHNRIKEACRNLVEEQERTHTHLKYGKCLMKHSLDTDDDELMLLAINQIDLGGVSAKASQGSSTSTPRNTKQIELIRETEVLRYISGG